MRCIYDRANQNERNELYYGNGQGFTQQLFGSFVTGSMYSTGLAVADLDGQNGPDIVVSNYGQPNQLFYNTGNGSFTEQKTGAFVSRCGRDCRGEGDFSWALAVEDINGDSRWVASALDS
jgi:hypothetical protein